MQRLIQEHNPSKVLFITYRQTLARDMSRNFKHLGFKNYLDSYDDPFVWESPRLIAQIDSLLNLVLKNCDVADNEAFELHYDMIVLDESESLLCHFDEKTMEKKEITIWNFFDELLRQCDKIVLMDGDVSNRTLSFASAYGQMVYIKNNNNETNKKINLVCDFAKWEAQLHKDLESFYKEDPHFRICIASQSSTTAMSIEEDTIQRFPYLNVKRLI